MSEITNGRPLFRQAAVLQFVKKKQLFDAIQQVTGETKGISNKEILLYRYGIKADGSPDCKTRDIPYVRQRFGLSEFQVRALDVSLLTVFRTSKEAANMAMAA